ncbi:MAG: cobalamin-binding protein [Nocardioidaceae bacterium]|nr:cobalamin-binding protein [Nocardioidaceae bacterium]
MSHRAAPRRVVCLVPSLTEAIAVTVPDRLAGATEWCTEPPGLDVARFGGTKNPDVTAIVAARPDLVVVNTEENRAVDLDALRRAGVRLWVTDPQTVPEAITQLRDLLTALGAARVPWLEAAETQWARPWTGERKRAVVPIWRRPWMALGRDTFAGDVLARIGVDNVLAGDDERYPRIDITALPRHDLVVLPDEPYAFSVADGPEAFAAASACVSGRYLTWYGPSLAEARDVLSAQVWTAVEA